MKNSSIFLLMAMLTFNAKSAVTCQDVLTINSTDGGIFSLQSFNQHLYIGMFGYDYDAGTADDTMIYRLNSNNSLSPSDLNKSRLVDSESICTMANWNGHLYAGTERAGRIFRSSNGINWNEVYGQGRRDTCDFATGVYRNEPTLLAPQTHGGVYLWTQDGVNWTQGIITTQGDPYFRESVYFNGYWYAYGIKRTTKEPIAYRSSDLTGWSKILSPGRVFRTNIIGQKLYLSNAARPAYGQHNTIALRSTANGTSYNDLYVSGFQTYSHLNTVYQVEIDNEMKFIATVSRGFKPLDNPEFGQSGSSALVQFNSNGAYEKHLCEFNNQEYAEATAWHNGNLYIGTMHGGYENQHRGNGYGKLYKVIGVNQYKKNNIIPILTILLLDD